MFPSNHANRAANRHLSAASISCDASSASCWSPGPSFLTIHLTLAHWPYAWAGKSAAERARGVPGRLRHGGHRSRPSIRRRARECSLDKGVLENAIVVVLSDHGEALGADDDSMLRENRHRRRDLGFALGTRHERDEPEPVPGAAGDARLRPRVIARAGSRLQLARFTRGLAADARGNCDRSGARTASTASRCCRTCELRSSPHRWIAACVSPKPISIRQAAGGALRGIGPRRRGGACITRLDPETGWVQFRADELPELIARKQRAALSSARFLAVIPARQAAIRSTSCTAGSTRPTGPGRLSEPATDPEAYRLWTAALSPLSGRIGSQPPNRPECEPGQALAGRTYGSIRAHLTIAGSLG